MPSGSSTGNSGYSPYSYDAPSGGNVAVAIPAGIAAVGTLGGAALGGKAAKEAAKIQLQGTREALAFQREQETARRAEYDKAMGQYEAKWGAWNASRNALLQRYGIDVGPAPAPPASAPTVAKQPPTPEAQRAVAEARMMAGLHKSNNRTVNDFLASSGLGPDGMPLNPTGSAPAGLRPGQPAGMPQPGGPAGMPPGDAGGMPQVAQGQNLGQLMRPRQELGAWNDWEQQGLRA